MARQANVAPEQLQQHGRCPQGRLLPANVGEAIDYIDFFKLGGRSYEAVRIPVRPSQLGPVIGHIRCSLTASEDPHHGAPPVINGTAAFLPAGAPVYALRGYPPSCRLAAYLDGRLQIYAARTDTDGQSAPNTAPCTEQLPQHTAAGG
jgi:hypothetical protein